MLNKNIISSNSFLDFKIFSVKERKIAKNDFVGCNQKQILVVCDSKEWENEELQSFLKKILSAVTLDTEKDIALFLIKEEMPHFTHFTTSVDFDKMLVFGTTPQALGLQSLLKQYQIGLVQERQLLFVDNLSKIVKDKNCKAGLWNNMKLMFKS